MSMAPAARDVLLGAVRDLYRSLVALGACNVLATFAAMAAISAGWLHPLLGLAAAVLLVGLALDLLACAAVAVVERGRIDLRMLATVARGVRVRRALAGGSVVVLVPLVGVHAVAAYVRMESSLGIALAAVAVWIVGLALAVSLVAWPGALAAARAGEPIGLRRAVRASLVLLAGAGPTCAAVFAGVALVLGLMASLVVPLATAGFAFAALAGARLVSAPLDAPVAERHELAA